MVHKYEPLNLVAGEIRLLTLLPGAPTDPIRVFIHAERLPVNTWEAPPYEALSYVWGRQCGAERATVAVKPTNGDGLDTHIEVAENLKACLPYLRYRRRPRVLWIDTICIDQSNVVEKGHCVKRMAEIYNSAARVIIWLGPESPSSTNAMKVMEWLGSKVIVNWKARSMMLASETTLGDLDNVMVRDLDIVLLLLDRSWFERLWVQQEAKLARHAQVVCGATSVDWRLFRNALFCLWHFSQRRELPGDIVERMNRFYKLIAKTSFTLDELLFITKTRKCSDPRDRLYALLGLIGGREKKLNIQPDYSKTAPQVYKDLIETYLKNLRRLDPVACCEPSSSKSDVPSWVPDWDNPRKSKPFHLKRHPATFVAQAKILNECILCANGVRIASVQKVIPLDIPSRASSQEIVDQIIAIAPTGLWKESHERNRKIDTFCRVIVADHFRDRWNPPDGQEAIESEGRQLLHYILAGEFSEQKHLAEIPTATRYLSLVRLYAANRSFLVTDDGCFALGPIATKPGATICMLLGCKAPLVLQATSSGREELYNLVGECYLDSVVAGQLLLGQLPRHFQNVTSYDSSVDTFTDSFKNLSNGQFQREDPRLEAKLGEGYSKNFADNEECHEAEAIAAL